MHALYSYPYPGTPGEVSTIEDLAPGTYQLRAIARAGAERAVATVIFTIPSFPEICTVNLINRGVTVSGDTAIIEFGGFGPAFGYRCSLDNGPPPRCENKPKMGAFYRVVLL